MQEIEMELMLVYLRILEITNILLELNEARPYYNESGSLFREIHFRRASSSFSVRTLENVLLFRLRV